MLLATSIAQDTLKRHGPLMRVAGP